MSTSRPGDYSLGYASHPGQPRSTSPSANNSPIELSAGANARPAFGLVGGLSSSSMLGGNPRSGAGSPSHDLSGSSRLFSKRAREIQAQEGVPGLPLNPWGGPPTSGNSTPLRENIPESPTDGFPDFGQLPTPESITQSRRPRAGTVPSRFSPGGAGTGHLNVPGIGGAATSARNTPSQSPFNKSPSPGLEASENPSGGSALLSRLRAGSLPQRSQYNRNAGSGASSPFGPSIFSSWNAPNIGRERGSTLASIASVPSNPSNDPSSPSRSQFSREGGNESDVHMRTLDYLGLAETPQSGMSSSGVQLATPYMANMRQSSRIRSYSVNNKDLHASEYPTEDYDDGLSYEYIQDQLEKTQAAILHHNMAVQAHLNQTTSNRRRARTAGVLDAPHSQLMNAYFPNSIPTAANPLGVKDTGMMEEGSFDDMSQSFGNLGLARSNSRNAGLLNPDEQSIIDGPTNSLWLGNIPTSTTTTTLIEMFKSHGKIKSARVLTHKNCGFVNFDKVESAVAAKASMNGKEIFPGSSPIRINFAKPTSESNTPSHDGAFPSPSPDPFANQETNQMPSSAAPGEPVGAATANSVIPSPAELWDITGDILDIVAQLGATDQDRQKISEHLQNALAFDGHVEAVPHVGDASPNRTHDAPKLRDLRKRIDNQHITQEEIEQSALEMLPEIAEISWDYLGNTVVQKLFEKCSDSVRDAMLEKIAPHLAKIGCHKNGTWAAQKIIEVCKTPHQMELIATHLHPYCAALLLDQFGNYVVQGCLKNGAPYNNFIFETMLSNLMRLAKERFAVRAMRACLESHHAAPDQQQMLAAQLAIHSAHLATDANCALLLTWYLDTCTLPQRRNVLAPRIAPHLVQFCTQKVAYLTVLKVINQKAEPEARELIVNSLFFSPNDQVLEPILRDTANGTNLIFKVLTTPFFDEQIRSDVATNVKNVLTKIKAQPSAGYKRLMDEVGMSSSRSGGGSRDSSTHPEQRQRPNSRHANMNGHQGQQGNKQFCNQNQQQGAYDMGYGQQRGDMPDGGNMQAFPSFGQPMMYNGPNGAMPPMNVQQQMPYQQSMMGRGGAPMNYNFMNMPGYNAFASPGGDQYRSVNMPNGSPLQAPATMQQMPGQGAYAPPPGFGVPMGGGYPYGNVGGMPGMNYGQPGPQGPQGQGNRRSHK